MTKYKKMQKPPSNKIKYRQFKYLGNSKYANCQFKKLTIIGNCYTNQRINDDIADFSSLETVSYPPPNFVSIFSFFDIINCVGNQ
jgi:hypothetical protein